MPSKDLTPSSDDVPKAKSNGFKVRKVTSFEEFVAENIRILRAGLSQGAIVAQEQDPEYEEGIARWSKAAEKRAALVVFPTTPEDVSKAIIFSAFNRLEVAVSGGGHGSSGASSTQGGMNINLSRMRQVSIDVEKKTLIAEGGCLWKDVDLLAGKHGLAVVGGTVNHTGVGGLTLGGGYSYLTPEHGMTIDNLLSVEYVLADGSIVTASATDNQDLFWAARGAGACFGVATKFVYRCHDQPNNIWAAKLIFEASRFEKVMDFATDITAAKDRKSWLFVGSGFMPPKLNTPSIICTCFHNGSAEDAMQIFGPLTKLSGQLYHKQVQMPYYEMNSFINEGLAHGQRRSMKGCAYMPTSVREVGQHAFQSLYDFVKEVPDAGHSLVLLELNNYDKVCEVEQTATAFANRSRCCNLLIIMTWNDPNNDARVRSFGHKEVAHAQRRFAKDKAVLASDGILDNFTASFVGMYANHDIPQVSAKLPLAKTVFGPNYERLVELKKKYDSTDVFSKGVKLLES